MDAAVLPTNDLSLLRSQISQGQLPKDLTDKLNQQINRLEKVISTNNFRPEFDREIQYLNFVSKLPFNRSSQDILDLHRAAEILEKNHYGLKTAKERILEYLSVLILNARQGQRLRSQVLAFVGLVGSGKTSLAYSIAESLGRKIVRIPLGGLGSVEQLKGESWVKIDGEPGQILKSIHNCGFNNPVVLLDEIDRVAQETRADVMGILVELLDPEQNFAFVDRFVDTPFDLSKVLFIATANNLTNVATAVVDRLEVIEMPSYTDEEKIVIGRDYLLPKLLQEAGLDKKVVLIEENLWPKIVRPLGYDAGIRSLQRHVQTIIRKIAKNVVEGNPGPYNLNENNIGEYLN